MAVPFPVSGQRAQHPATVLTQLSARDWGERRREEREKRGEQAEAGAQEVGGEAAGVSDREGGGCSSSAGSLGVTWGELSPLCRGPATQSCCKALPSLPAKLPCDLLRPFLLLPHTWHPGLGICRACTAQTPKSAQNRPQPTTSSTPGPVLAAARTHHFLTPHMTGCPGPTAVSVLGDTRSSRVYSNSQGAFCSEAQAFFSTFFSLSCLPTPTKSF